MNTIRSYCQAVVISMMLLGGFHSTSFAQNSGRNTGRLLNGGSIPDAAYYNLRQVSFYQGDYREALRDFNRLENSALKFGSERFLDSICYWTMQGECHYQVGNYQQALAFYEQAISLFLGFEKVGWQSRIQEVPAILADNSAVQRARVNWGVSGRQFTVAKVPDSMGVMTGRLDAERAWVQGGVLANPEVRRVDIAEVMRCIGLAIYRRNVILGPTSKYSTTSVQIVAGLGKSTGLGGGPLFTAFNNVLLGLAQAGIEEYEESSKSLAAGLQFNGMDHNLTSLALLQIGQIGLATENLEAAAMFGSEASYTAAIFGQADTVDDAFNLVAKVHMMKNNTPFPALALAMQWARQDRYHKLYASLAVTLAETYCEAGQTKDAIAALSQANQANSRNSLATPRIGGRFKYVQATADFQNDNFTSGMTHLDAALKSYRPGSLWLYRLALTETLAASNNIGERQADLLYGALLRDPSATDWKLDPLETMAFMAADHITPMERWFEISILRKDYEKALEIAELTRRHRFFSQLPMGGRTLAFRWVTHAPVDLLSTVAQDQRREFLSRYTDFQTAKNRAEQLHTALSLLPVMPEAGSDQAVEQAKLLKELMDNSRAQESFLANLSARRIPAEMAFPPQYPLSDFRTKLKEHQAALVTFGTAYAYHHFLVKANTSQYLGSLKEKEVQRSIGGVLKQMGASEPAVEVKLLSSTDWKSAVKPATEKLFGSLRVDELMKFKELVVVPDGLYWYFPYELIPVDDKEMLVNKIEIRYSPTLFLAYEGKRKLREMKNLGVIVNKTHLKGAVETTLTAFQELAKEVPAALKIESIPKKVSVAGVGALLDQALVWSEYQIGNGNPFGSPFLGVGPAEPASLGDWISLPWRAPDTMVIPAFQSDAGNGFRGRRVGMDLFLTTLGMMASGNRSILISRWRTGGGNCLAFSRNYFQRLGKMPTAQAYKEAIDAAKELELNYKEEPQVRFKKSDKPIKADHPYFWASYMRMEIPLADASDSSTKTTPPESEPEGEGAAKDKIDPPKIEPPKVGEAQQMKEEPKKEDPKKEEPNKDEPKKEEPNKEEPKKDEPKKDEPKKKFVVDEVTSPVHLP